MTPAAARVTPCQLLKLSSTSVMMLSCLKSPTQKTEYDNATSVNGASISQYEELGRPAGHKISHTALSHMKRGIRLEGLILSIFSI
ncbi:hypothetical protein E2C01_039548 [Portunus trituberculatus]|uniref:Uncharacterized protein n=1 Tax=Portunus trituberculatus TaxID=210409 RepID=A0A5B7FH46_PORTR|nr:hypothetical protein [Portunus trituberculatus]